MGTPFTQTTFLTLFADGNIKTAKPQTELSCHRVLYEILECPEWSTENIQFPESSILLKTTHAAALRGNANRARPHLTQTSVFTSFSNGESQDRPQSSAAGKREAEANEGEESLQRGQSVAKWAADALGNWFTTSTTTAS